jgi:hypothetical protein
MLTVTIIMSILLSVVVLSHCHYAECHYAKGRGAISVDDEKSKINYPLCKGQWKGSNCKQSARWQHASWLKASAFCIWKNILWWFKTQQLILGTGTAIWWVTEPN